MKLRVGLIGLGEAWESRHRPALRSLSDRFEVRAVCCEVAHKAESVAREFNAQSVDGFRAMIGREDIDAVLALAPDWVGALPILAACEGGKAVYSSAALDIEPELAPLIKERVEASGVAFMAELPRRHAPATLRLKELIATHLGKPQLLFCHQRQSCEERIEPARRGSHCPVAMRDFMELVDWCRYVVSLDPCSVVSTRHEHTIGGMPADYEVMSLSFPPAEPGTEGALVQISNGHYIPARWGDALAFQRPASLQVCCERGVAFVDLPSTIIWFDDAGQHMESLESDRPVGEQLLTHFHRAVTSLIRKTSDLDDAYKALTIVLRAGQSRVDGKSVDLRF